MSVAQQDIMCADVPVRRRRDAIPEELRSKNIWLRWKLEKREGRITKIPYQSNGNGLAKSNDPTTWSSFDDATESNIGDGLGCVVKDGLVAIDLDKVRDPASSVIEPWAQSIVDECASYTEISPSKTGVHIWLRGEVPMGGNRKGRMEMYDRSSPRYMTVTGDVLNETPIREFDLSGLHTRMMNGADPTQPKPTTEGIDDSNADFAFCRKLAQEGKTAKEIDAALRASTLMRPKWDERRGRQTYGERTVAHAMAGVAILTPLSMERMTGVKAEKIEWVWEGRFPLGMVISLIGQGGVGKSMLTEDIAMRVSRGADWPDGAKNKLKPSDVVLLNSEDSASQSQRPRLESMGADLNRIIRIKLEDDGFALDADIPRLEKNLEQLPDVRLVVIDPVANHLGKVNANSAPEVREGVLKPLASLAKRFNVCVIVVCHTNKKEGMSAINRVDGSQAFVSGVRGSWLLLPCDEDDLSEGEKGIVLQFNKSNAFSPKRGLKCRTVPATITTDEGVVIRTARILWGAETETSAQETLDAITDPTERKSKRVESWLREFLCDESKRATVVYQAAKEMGFSEDQIQRASQKVKVVKSRESTKGGYSVWSLPVGASGATMSTPQSEFQHSAEW